MLAKNQKLQMVVIFIMLLWSDYIFCSGMEFQKEIPTTENRARVIAKQFSSDLAEEAKISASKDDYKSAYEKLLISIEEMQSEVKNLKGLVQYYKDELSKLSAPYPNVDYSYNEAANRLWASAWDLQHDGVFKKMGSEREAYLEKAVETYRRIVIDYPYSGRAEEAQYRIARIYYKFIKDYKLAERELQKYKDIYPRGRFTSEASELLVRIRRK